TARADSAAFASECTRTLLKLCPNRFSISRRIEPSSGFPGELRTCSTIAGASETSGWLTLLRWGRLGPDPAHCLSRHSSQAPAPDPSQAHLRRNVVSGALITRLATRSASFS